MEAAILFPGLLAPVLLGLAAATWVGVIGALTVVWRQILRLDPSNPLLALLAFIWTIVTIATSLGLLMGTLLAYGFRNGGPPCGPFRGMP